MRQPENDLRTNLFICMACPCILVLFALVATFFIAPETIRKYIPAICEYPVVIDVTRVSEYNQHEPGPVEKAFVWVKTAWEGNKSPSVPVASSSTADTTTSNKQSADDTPVETIANNPPVETPAAPQPNPGSDAAIAYNSTPPSTPQVNTETAPKLTPQKQPPPKKGKPLQFTKKTVNGVPLYLGIVDLKDPEMFITIELANKAEQANSSYASYGDESFDSLVKRSKGALVQNGTFFSKDTQKRVMGNLIAGGKFLKYSEWENYGTTLGIKANNELEMTTARVDGQPDWSKHWFSITCGPRLVHSGSVYTNGEEEGFADSHVLQVGARCAIGYPASKDKLYIVTFLKGLSLNAEAEAMKALGCYDAMNLDGGASRAVAYNGNIVVPAHRPLTNVIVVYDTKHPAPENLVTSWNDFQKNPTVATNY